MPICYQNSWERNAAQVICNQIKGSSYVGLPYKVNAADTNNYDRFLTDVACAKPNDNLSKCNSFLSESCNNMAGVACLKEKSFKLPCHICPLQAMGAIVIATKPDHEWTLRETNVF